MNKDTLDQLASLATVSQHLSALYNSRSTPKNMLNKLEQTRLELDRQFVQLVLEVPQNLEQDDYNFAARLKEEKDKLAAATAAARADATKSDTSKSVMVEKQAEVASEEAKPAAKTTKKASPKAKAVKKVSGDEATNKPQS